MSSCPKWPPRSPHEALLSSPTGRRKLRQAQDRTSPSPLKKASSTTSNTNKEVTMDDDDDDDDDEETLQLRLETLEARLKLKRLQRKRLKAENIDSDREQRSSDGLNARSGRDTARQHNITINQISSTQPKSSDVQVYVSPQKRVVEVEAPSPGRVLLGIDRGLRGKNMSLRRPPISRTRETKDDDPFSGSSCMPNSRDHISSVSQLEKIPRPKSFSQRIAETRLHDNDQKAKSHRLRKQRSTGFGIQQKDLDAFKDASTSVTENSEQKNNRGTTEEIEFSRDEVLKAVNQPAGGLVQRSKTVSGGRNARSNECQRPNRSNSFSLCPGTSERTNHRPRTRSGTPPASIKQFDSSSMSSAADDPLLEQYSAIHLSKRLIPHTFLSHTFAQKHISLLPSLLASIKSPCYNLPPELESDFIVLGIIASKSTPLSHKDAHKSTSTSDVTSLAEATESNMNARGKYIVLTLTDLKWTLDLYLFTTAYTRFWKLTPGTLIAILNPSVMPPPPGKADTGRFSLVLNSSDDTILEIGTARDLAWCQSVRKDGKQCGSWVDSRHTRFCEWHVDRGVESMRKGRMEVNGMSAPFGPGGKKGGRTGFWGGKRKSEKQGEGLLREGPQWDRATGSTYFIGPSVAGGRSAASLLDAEGGAEARGGSREERIRKRLAERAREKEIARKLGEGGNGIGSDYLRLKAEKPKRAGSLGEAKSGNDAVAETWDAKTLGLLGNRAVDVQLSPVRRGEKRKAATGDGGGMEPPRSKKTRFVTDQGIKIAGRESLGAAVCEVARDGDGDEDDLDIV